MADAANHANLPTLLPFRISRRVFPGLPLTRTDISVFCSLRNRAFDW